MKEQLKKRILELTDLIGVSGHEWDVARYIKNALEGSVDSIEVRPNGSVIAMKRGAKPGPRVMVTAHMDEVGYIVKYVSPDGFLYFDKVGEATELCLPGRRVLVKGSKDAVKGVIGVRSQHLLTAEQRSHPQTVSQSYVDLCCGSREEVARLGIGPGAQIVPDSPMTEMQDPDCLCTRAADDRVLCGVLVELMRNIPREDIHGELYALFNVLEESALNGACPAVNYIKPLYGIFLDTVPCGDVPDCNYERELPIAMKQGPTIILEQELLACCFYCVSHPKLVEAFRESCAEEGVPHQEIVFNGAAYITDAVTANNAGDGIAVLGISVPRRYSHSPTEIFHMEDAVNCEKAVMNLLKKNVDLNMM